MTMAIEAINNLEPACRFISPPSKVGIA